MREFARALPGLSTALSAFRWRRMPHRLPPRLTFAIQIVSDAQMARLNTSYRGKRGTTDVLAFSYLEHSAPIFEHETAGEIYVALPQAARQAKLEGHSLAHELLVLVIHGALHLLGYDHEKGETEEAIMRRAEKELLATLAPLKTSTRVLTAR